MKILYVTTKLDQSSLMHEAMRRRGHDLVVVDPYVLTRNWAVAYWTWHTGGILTNKAVELYLRKSVANQKFDLAFVDNGELISRRSVELLRKCSRRVVLFCRDNPFVQRDGRRWGSLLDALPLYDLYVTRRKSTAEAAAKFGAKAVFRITLFADEVLHQPHPPNDDEIKRFGSPVSFIGTWFPERGPFMERLLARGVPLKIIGHRWDRAENFESIRDAVVPGYLSATEYSAAVRSCKIAIGMLSKGNEDLHTARSLEIPAMGTVLCAERTTEHVEMYREGVEAIFWSSADECADQCLSLLAEPSKITQIAQAGHARMLASDNWAEKALERIIDAAFSLTDADVASADVR